jgi:Cu(I)/Ag(I) efflux system membrane fusion protein
VRTLITLLAIAAAGAGGYGYGRWYAKPAAGARQPVYYIDPMHPWYKSPQPGIAPDCNMKLVPVYPG